ncbi:ABC transporter substrate-binding protein [Rhodospirillaceae bacterium SYSU D60014]|uniref:ABC transporter substrate-binding protein n=1 Tax=Virgifigura deserti TaxID=2268457 RepID=UPI000E66A9E1
MSSLKTLYSHAAGIAVAFGLGASLSGSAQAADLGAVDEPIRLAMVEWTGARITTEIAGNVLERMGYEVEYVTAGNYPQFTALADGSLHATLEVWTNNAGELYPKLKEAGKIVDIGPLGLETREGWMYPVHMKSICPGLPDWKALKDCANQLATAETFPNGRILSYPADWGTRSVDMIKGLDIPFEALPAGSEGALVAELKAAVQTEKPLVMMFWAPHWVLAEVDVEWVDLPKYEPACTEDPSWGPNPNAVNDCGVSPPLVNKAAWTGFEKKWPAAWEFLKNFQMDAKEQEKLMLRIDQQGEDLEAATTAWVEENKAVWEPWVKAAM